MGTFWKEIFQLSRKNLSLPGVLFTKTICVQTGIFYKQVNSFSGYHPYNNNIERYKNAFNR